METERVAETSDGMMGATTMGGTTTTGEGTTTEDGWARQGSADWEQAVQVVRVCCSQGSGQNVRRMCVGGDAHMMRL